MLFGETVAVYCENHTKKTKRRGLSPRANYTDRAQNEVTPAALYPKKSSGTHLCYRLSKIRFFKIVYPEIRMNKEPVHSRALLSCTAHKLQAQFREAGHAIKQLMRFLGNGL
jgi:hypothetical protein